MRSLLALTATALVAGFAFLAVGGDEGDRAPVPLYKPPPRGPEATLGSGIAPAVAVRVRIDDRGKVVEVAIDRIDPATEFDDLFREATVETLSSWRFAPAWEDGKTIETWLTWTVQYVPREATEETGESVEFRPTSLLLSETARRIDRRWEIVAMQPRIRFEMLKRTARAAEAQLVAARRQVAETPNFIVVTDASNKGVGEVLANNLEAGYGVIHGLLADKVPAQPTHGKVLCYFYSNKGAFKALATLGAYEWSAGFYAPEGLIAFHMQMPTNEHLREVMLHETVHAFLDRHVVRPGARLPMWLDEGLADYIGNSEVRRKKLIPGKYRRHQIYHGPMGTVGMGKSITNLEAAEVKEAIRKNKAIKLHDLVGAQRDEFYGEKRSMFYTQSWMLVHFLRHGREEWADDQFPRFVLYVAEGYSPLEAMEHVYGVRPADLEGEFKKYVKQF